MIQLNSRKIRTSNEELLIIKKKHASRSLKLKFIHFRHPSTSIPGSTINFRNHQFNFLQRMITVVFVNGCMNEYYKILTQEHAPAATC